MAASVDELAQVEGVSLALAEKTRRCTERAAQRSWLAHDRRDSHNNRQEGFSLATKPARMNLCVTLRPLLALARRPSRALTAVPRKLLLPTRRPPAKKRQIAHAVQCSPILLTWLRVAPSRCLSCCFIGQTPLCIYPHAMAWRR